MPNLNDTIRRRAGVVGRDTPDGAVLVDMADGRCFELNRVGAFYWLSLDAGARVLRDICDAVARKFAAPREVIERDLLELTGMLTRNGLVEISSPVNLASP